MAKKKYSAGPVPKEAVEFFDSKGWKVGFDHRDVWREEHAYAFTAAKAMEVDVLVSIRDAVRQAIAEGQTFEQFQTDLTPTLQKLGWWGRKDEVDPKTGEALPVQLGSARRLRTIYRQNLRTAQAAGQWARVQRTKTGLPYLRYRIGPSEHHRPEHVAWDGLILSADDPWWDTHYPPNGWGCKCWAQQLSEYAAGKAGGVGKAPPSQTVDWINPRTGKTEKIPMGITPGFDYNPGKSRMMKELVWFTQRLDVIDDSAAAAVHRAWFQPGIFGQWRKNPQGKIPVGILDSAAGKQIGTDRSAVLLAAETVAGLSKDLSNDEFALLAEIIRDGRRTRRGKTTLFAREKNGHRYEAAVEKSEFDPLLTSFRKH
ncbi:MAG: phage minor head protein [Kiritimatiellales bacterium]